MSGTKPLKRALCLLILSLAFCAYAWAGQTKVEWNVTHRFAPEFYKDLLQPWADTNNIDFNIELVNAGAGWVNLIELLTVRTAGGVPPDVVWVSSEILRQLVKAGLLEPLDSYMERAPSGFWDDIPQSLLDAGRVDGRLYMLPVEWNVSGLRCVNSVFDQGGVGLPSNDWNLDEMLSLAKKLTRMDSEGNIVQCGVNPRIPWFGTARPWFDIAGASLMTEDYSQSLINEKEVIDTFQLFIDMAWVYRVSPATVQGAVSFVPWAEGNVAMYIAGGPGNSEETFRLMPKWRTNKERISVNGFVMMAGSNRKDVAFESLIKFFDPETMLKAWKTESDNPLVFLPRWVPPRAFLLQENIPLLRDPAVKIGIETMMQATSPARALPPFNPPNISQITSVYQEKIISQVMEQTISPKEAAQKWHTEVMATLQGK